MTANLTVGKPSRVLWRFSVPMLLSVVFQQCYSLVDGVIAGRVIGIDALAAVGASHPVTVLFLAIASGSTLGSAVVIGQLFGAGDGPSVKTAVSTASRAFLAASLVISAAGMALAPQLLGLLQTPGEVMPLAVTYLRIYIGGFPFLYLYNIATGTLNALGDSKTPLYFLVISSVLNIVLDILFTVVLRWGIEGISWATLLAQAVAGSAAAVVAARRVASIEGDVQGKRFDPALLRRILRLGIPSMFQQIFIAIGQMSIQGVVNSYGAVVVAGYTAAFKINGMMVMAFNTVSNAVSAYCAQNIGAGRWDRVRQGMGAALRMMLCIAGIAVPILLIWRESIIGLFIAQDSQDAVSVGTEFLCIVSPFYLLVCFKIVADGVLRGIGAMRQFMAATFMDLLVRIALSQLLYRFFHVDSVILWWIWPVAWIVGTGCSVYFCYKRLKYAT